MNETNVSNMQTTIPENSYHHKKISNKLMNTVPPRLMSDTVRNILNTFTFFDLNANQFIEINELKRILNALNFKKTTDECYDIIHTYDLNNDQMIDFHEFIFALARLIKHDVFTLIDIQQRFK
jgi:Ca2+-binding EF-hand superfamily protein